MKRAIVFILCSLFVVFSACQNPNIAEKLKGNDVGTTIVEYKETDEINKEPHFDNSTKDEEEANVNNDELIKKYIADYNAHSVFNDIYVQEKNLIISDEEVVELFIIGDFCDVKSLKKAEIERIEHTVFEEFAAIRVFDKTGKMVSISVAPKEVEKVLGLIR